MSKSQKELKAILHEALTDAWKGDEKMINFCLKESSHIIELSTGQIISFSKPRIETSFCFGYGMYGVSTDEEHKDAQGMADYAKTYEKYFINENLKDLEERIKELKNYLRSHFPGEKIVIMPRYCRQSKDNPLVQYTYSNPYSHQYSFDFPKATDEDIKRIIEGLEVVKARFTKRLKTYLKRYGLSKVRTWTYLVD